MKLSRKIIIAVSACATLITNSMLLAAPPAVPPMLAEGTCGGWQTLCTNWWDPCESEYAYESACMAVALYIDCGAGTMLTDWGHSCNWSSSCYDPIEDEYFSGTEIQCRFS